MWRSLISRDGNINQLTHVNKDVMDFIKLGAVEEIWYKSHRWY